MIIHIPTIHHYLKTGRCQHNIIYHLSPGHGGGGNNTILIFNLPGLVLWFVYLHHTRSHEQPTSEQEQTSHNALYKVKQSEIKNNKTSVESVKLGKTLDLSKSMS